MSYLQDPSLSDLDIDEKYRERLKSIWYFPEYHPIAFLYDYIFFRLSLNWVIKGILLDENITSETPRLHKIYYKFDIGWSFFYGLLFVLLFWGGGLGLLLLFPLFLVFPFLLNSEFNFPFVLVGLYAAYKIGSGRLEVLRAIRKAEQLKNSK